MDADNLWGEIVEVEREYMPSRTRSKWYSLFEELRLRLEQTHYDKALFVPFDNPKFAESAYHALKKMKWPTSVDMVCRGGKLFVAHGRNLTRQSKQGRPRKLRPEEDADDQSSNHDDI